MDSCRDGPNLNDWVAITDLDGTIVDSEESNLVALTTLLSEFGLLEKMGTVMAGLTAGKTFDEITIEMGISVEQRKRMEDRMGSLLTQGPAPPLPGTISNIRDLRDLGLLFSLATDNLMVVAEKAIGELGISDLFRPDLVLTSDNFRYRKPAREIVMEIHRRSGRRKAVVIGNTPKDVAMAMRSGCPVVVLTPGPEKDVTCMDPREAIEPGWSPDRGQPDGSIHVVQDWEGVRKAILEISSGRHGPDIHGAGETGGTPNLEDFLVMEREEVAKIVSGNNLARSVVLVPDGNRKAGLILWGLDPSAKDFDRSLFSRMHSRFLEVVRCFLELGVRELYIPTVTKRNFDRGKAYMEAAIGEGLAHFFHDPLWLGFYKELDVRVRFYGDRDLLRSRGFETLLGWMANLETATARNRGPLLFLGLACDRSHEEVRLAEIGVEWYLKNGRVPTRKELIRLYYGLEVQDAGVFIRPTEIRDSDMLPVLISEYKTQLYFPVCPVGHLGERAIRTIFHDLMYERFASGGRKMYSKDTLYDVDLGYMKAFLSSNKDAVIGVGTRHGPFWVPLPRPLEAGPVSPSRPDQPGEIPFDGARGPDEGHP